MHRTLEHCEYLNADSVFPYSREGINTATLSVLKRLGEIEKLIPDIVQQRYTQETGGWLPWAECQGKYGRSRRMGLAQVGDTNYVDPSVRFRKTNNMECMGERGSVVKYGENGHENCVERLEDCPSYVNYALVAENRVKDARRKRRNKTNRGPACPVCQG